MYYFCISNYPRTPDGKLKFTSLDFCLQRLDFMHIDDTTPNSVKFKDSVKITQGLRTNNASNRKQFPVFRVLIRVRLACPTDNIPKRINS